MKKYWLGVMTVITLLAGLYLNPLHVQAENYYYEGATGWYKGDRPGSVDSIKMEAIPKVEDLNSGDFVTFDCNPDAAEREWLENLQGEQQWVLTFFHCEGEIKIGKEGGNLSLSTLNAYSGNLVLNGNAGDVRAECPSILVTGNVTDRFMVLRESGEKNDYHVQGDVERFSMRTYAEVNGRKYGFGGNVKIDGVVKNAQLQSLYKITEKGTMVWGMADTVTDCPKGVFEVTNGQLSDRVPIVKVDMDSVKTYNSYSCSQNGTTNFWHVQVYYEDHTLAYDEVCTIEDVEANGKVNIYSVSEQTPVVLNVPLQYCNIYLEGTSDTTGKVIINGDVEVANVNTTGPAWDVQFNGNVASMSVRPMPNERHNLSVKGDLQSVQVWNENYSKLVKEGKGKNVTILKDGKWVFSNLEEKNSIPENLTVVTVNANNESFAMDEDGKLHCFDENGREVINEFKCDDVYTYYFQADGTAMQDKLTYHPDGVHVIYFDENGHEVFSNFANVKKTIAGDEVDDFCFFDMNGYLYVDVVTYDQTGTRLFYANEYGVMSRKKWFRFSDSCKWADGTPFDRAGGDYGYATEDGSLMINQYTYDWEGNYCYMQGNGVAKY